MKTLILYIYHKNDKKIFYEKNVTYFLENGIFKHEDYKFILILNSDKINETYKKSFDNYDIYYRKNIGYDFGGWSEIILDNNLQNIYDNFIFINSSCIGPYINKDFKGYWPEIFLNKLNENVRLVGTTINTANCLNQNDVINNSHVQSWFFCMNQDTLKFLIKNDIFSKNYINNKVELINKCEIGMSRLLINNGWNIACLMKDYNGIDFTFKNKKPEDYKIKFIAHYGLRLKYNGRKIDINPEELVFLKATINK